MPTIDLTSTIESLASALRARSWRMATAESCTGGLIAGACTSLAGSSDWFERGYVTYSNASKTEMLGVDAALIAQHGAVSEEVARAMAHGARTRARVDVALSVTGVAGPGGGTALKPVGLVCFAWAVGEQPAQSQSMRWSGGRDEVRQASVAHALGQLIHRMG
jgi:nicotinamide-nucleotide amidase